MVVGTLKPSGLSHLEFKANTDATGLGIHKMAMHLLSKFVNVNPYEWFLFRYDHTSALKDAHYYDNLMDIVRSLIICDLKVDFCWVY